MTDRAIVLQAASAGLSQDRQLIARGWDLAELARSYRRFVADFQHIRRALDDAAQIEPEQAFVVRTLLIHEYRKIHLRDPLLPRDLLPHAWIGADAYDLCRHLYRCVFEQAEDYLAINAAHLREPRAPAAAESSERFGIRPVRRLPAPRQ